MTASTIIENENDLFFNFLSQDPVASDIFVKTVEPRILRTARRIARDLPADIQLEIVQQTFANLLIAPASDFDPSRGTVKQFLIGKIWNAEKQVRRAYGYPIRRKQLAGDNATISLRLKFVSLEAAETQHIPARNLAKIFESDFYVATLSRKVSPQLATALRLLCYEDKSKEDAARLSGLSRFQLHRKLGELRSQLAV